TSKLVIYRLADNKIIYEGDNPQKILENTQKAIVENVVKKAKERGLIQNDSDETPQVAVVTDPNALRQANPEFYRDAQQNDILATFTASSVVVLYRPATDAIINAGNFVTNINAL